jgi:hypothetical protein
VVLKICFRYRAISCVAIISQLLFFVCFEIFSSFALIFQICALKVEGNEKLGGAGGWLLFKDGKRLWQSTSV